MLFPDDEDGQEPLRQGAEQPHEAEPVAKPAEPVEPVEPEKPKQKRASLGSKLRRAFGVFKGMLEEEEGGNDNG